MRLCGVCKKPPRHDDSLTHLQVNSLDAANGPGQAFLVSALGVSEGTTAALACRECAGAANGEPWSDPIYPPGCKMPPDPNSKDPSSLLPICGLCRRALREGDTPRSMRLEREDLIDAWWAHYADEMQPEREKVRAAIEPALWDWNCVAGPATEKHNREMANLQVEVARQIEDATLGADTQEEADQLAAEITAQHEHAFRLIEAECTAAVAVPRVALDSAMAKAAFPYRKAAIATYRKLAAAFADHSPSAEPGRYLACIDCLAKYRPRIIERLKRLGMVKPGVADEAIHGDWLM